MLPSGRDEQDPKLSNFRVCSRLAPKIGNALSRIIIAVGLPKCRRKRASQQDGRWKGHWFKGQADLGSQLLRSL